MRTRVGLIVATLVALTGCLASSAHAAPNDTTLQGRDTGISGAKQNSSSVETSVISADGRYIAFNSSATNLAGGFTGSYIYLRDTQTNTTTLVSRADGETGAPANAFVASPSISADGRFVAFESAANNLGVANPSSNIWVYVRDTVNHTTTLVSRADGAAGDPPDGDAGAASISGDGGSVAFRSAATNLDDDAGDGTQQVFVRDLTLNETVLASRADGATGSAGNDTSASPSLSADGTVVAFESAATNLDPADSSGTVSVFVRNVADDTTELVSRADGASGSNANNVAFDASISGDGDRIAFGSPATNLDASDAEISPDIFVRDRSASDTSLASASDLGAPGNGPDRQPAISADGRAVVFESGSSNLYPGFTGSFDVAMRDIQAGETHLISRADGASGAIGNASSRLPSVSADGTRVAFHSQATNLDPDDLDANPDVYMRETDIDVTAPTASIDSGPANRTADDTPTFTFSSTDGDVASFECLVDDAPVACSGSGTHTTAQLDNGSHIFGVRAVDASGNVGEVVEDLFSVDTTGPAVDLAATPGRTTDTTPSFSFTTGATDFAEFQCRVDAAAYAACTSPFTLAALAEGGHTFRVRALDNLGNLGSEVSRDITVDVTGPVAAIGSSPSGRTTDSTPTFSFTSGAGDLASFQCTVDAAPFTACTSPVTTAALTDGAHTFKVRALDDLGNTGTEVVRAVTIDTTGPTTAITSGPPATTPDSTPTFSFTSGAGDLASFQCTVDAAPFTACTSPVTTAALTDGAHTFKVRALDDLGNAGATEQVSFTVTTPAPPDTEVSDPEARLARNLTVSGKELAAVIGAGAGEDVEVTVTGAVSVKPKRGKSRTTALAPTSGSSAAGDQATLDLRYKGSKKKRRKLTKQLVNALADGGKATLSAEVELSDGAGNSVTLERTAKLKAKR